MSHYVLEKTIKKPSKRKDKLTNVARKYHCLKKENLKLEDFKPLYRLWCGYMTSFLTGSEANDERLIKADYHGALLSVSDSTNPSQSGISGIVVRESRNAIMLITHKDRILTIPKQGTTFQFILDGKLFSIFGDNFRATAAGRIQKKFKNVVLTKLLT